MRYVIDFLLGGLAGYLVTSFIMDRGIFGRGISRNSLTMGKHPVRFKMMPGTRVLYDDDEDIFYVLGESKE